MVVPIKASCHGKSCRLGAGPALRGGCGGGREGLLGCRRCRDIAGARFVGGGWSPDRDVFTRGDGAAVDGYRVTGGAFTVEFVHHKLNGYSGSCYYNNGIRPLSSAQ